MNTRQAWLSALADVLINLAAAWFGLILIVPPLVRIQSLEGIGTIVVNTGFGVLALLIAIKIRKMNT